MSLETNSRTIHIESRHHIQKLIVDLDMPDSEQSRNALCCRFEGWLWIRAPVKVECVAGSSHSCTWDGAPWAGFHGGCSEPVSNILFLLVPGRCSLEEPCLPWKVILCGILVKYFFSKSFSLGKLSRQILPQNSQGFLYSLIYTIKTVLIG